MTGKMIFLLLGILCAMTTCSCTADTALEEDLGNFKVIHEVVLQPVDHADPDGPKLEQHVDILIPDGVPADAPVFFNLGNEADLTDEHLIERFRLHGTQAPLIYVQAEHRGYGQSLTSDDDQSVPLYLSKEQALADAHEVIQQLKKEYGGPWMAAGWSYGGGLVIDFAYRYPEDVEVILSSSGVVDWPMMNYAYDRQIRAALGEGCYRRMTKHMDNLRPKELFDDKWYEQEFLTALIVGIVQYQEFNRLQRYCSLLSYLPTPVVLKAAHWLDNKYSKGKAHNYAQALRSRMVNRGQIASGDYSWHAWRYQQCAEVGVFFASEDQDGLLKRTSQDFCEECLALFGTASYADGPEWSLREKVQHLKVPLVYVSGGKDPWYALGLAADVPIENGKHFHVPQGFHCPDRDDPELARQVLREMLKFTFEDNPAADKDTRPQEATSGNS